MHTCMHDNENEIRLSCLLMKQSQTSIIDRRANAREKAGKGSAVEARIMEEKAIIDN